MAPTASSQFTRLHPAIVDETPHRLLAAVPADRDSGNEGAERHAPRASRRAGVRGQARVIRDTIVVASENS